jgi:predicted Zn-dependent peptidase
MCADEAFGIKKLGSEKDVQAITVESLTEHHQQLVRNSRIELFYCGTACPEKVHSAFKSALESLPARPGVKVPETDIVYKPISDTPRHFTEALDVTQGKLTIGFRLGDTMKNPDYPALMVFNAIYGGSVSSKLFLNVRERLSLCYYASSMIDKHKGVMLVTSGVEFDKFDAALDEIQAQLENVKACDISEWEMTAAKRTVITSLKSALDRSGGLEELYFDSVISTVNYDPVNLSELVDAVTVERVVNMASGIRTDSVYFLSGKENKEETDEVD